MPNVPELRQVALNTLVHVKQASQVEDEAQRIECRQVMFRYIGSTQLGCVSACLRHTLCISI